MSKVTRRGLMKASTYTAVALAAPAAAAQGGAAPPGKPRAGQTIQRFEPTTPVLPGLPKIHNAVVHGGIVYVAGTTLLQALPRAELLALAKPGGAPAGGLGDVADQTRRICGRIDQVLATAGTSKAKLLTAQVWLTDMKNFAAHNDAWNEWVDLDNAPVRACVVSPQLVFPGLLVEIMVTAAR
jgi:enamine deaminase RidA (YjgF/YER057c/UK114 family)